MYVYNIVNVCMYVRVYSVLCNGQPWRVAALHNGAGMCVVCRSHDCAFPVN